MWEINDFLGGVSGVDESETMIALRIQDRKVMGILEKDCTWVAFEIDCTFLKVVRSCHQWHP